MEVEVDEKNPTCCVTFNSNFPFYFANFARKRLISGLREIEWASLFMGAKYLPAIPNWSESTVISRGCCLSCFCNSWRDSYAVNYSDWAWCFGKKKNCNIKAQLVVVSSNTSELSFAPSLWDVSCFSVKWLKQAHNAGFWYLRMAETLLWSTYLMNSSVALQQEGPRFSSWFFLWSPRQVQWWWFQASV